MLIAFALSLRGANFELETRELGQYLGIRGALPPRRFASCAMTDPQAANATPALTVSPTSVQRQSDGQSSVLADSGEPPLASDLICA